MTVINYDHKKFYSVSQADFTADFYWTLFTHKGWNSTNILRSSYDNSGAQRYETFKAVIYKCLLQAEVFVFGRPFHSGLMLASKAGAYPRVDKVWLC